MTDFIFVGAYQLRERYLFLKLGQKQFCVRLQNVFR